MLSISKQFNPHHSFRLNSLYFYWCNLFHAKTFVRSVYQTPFYRVTLVSGSFNPIKLRTQLTENLLLMVISQGMSQLYQMGILVMSSVLSSELLVYWITFQWIQAQFCIIQQMPVIRTQLRIAQNVLISGMSDTWASLVRIPLRVENTYIRITYMHFVSDMRKVFRRWFLGPVCFYKRYSLSKNMFL